jgi:phosphoribosylformylglycinamidine synthase
VGDPFAEKVLIECCLELFAADVVDGISDLGAAGLSCALSELASAGDGGMDVRLDDVPLRDHTLAPEEILMSESQERMMAIVRPEDLDRFGKITDRWEVLATVLGEVTDTGRLHISWHGQSIVDVEPRSVAHDGPVYERPIARPAGQDALQAAGTDALPRPSDAAGVRAALLTVLGSPDQADKSWVTDQYDRYVQGNSAATMPDDAGVLRIDETSGLGVAIATDCNARFAELDPYAGAQLALAEACRNVACSGARPLAVTDCLNFGSPEDPGVMWQFQQAVHGLADACRDLALPVTGGNVSFYNQTGDQAIRPTPVVGVLGVLDDVATRIRSGWNAAGQRLLLLGRTRAELDASAWAYTVHGHQGGRPPALNLAAEARLHALLADAGRRLVATAHDLSDGGLAQALAESVLRYGVGATVDLTAACERDDVDGFTALFAESTGRVLVSLPAEHEQAFVAACAQADVPVVALGATGGDGLMVAGPFGGGRVEIGQDELARTWREPLRAAFAG